MPAVTLAIDCAHALCYDKLTDSKVMKCTLSIYAHVVWHQHEVHGQLHPHIHFRDVHRLLLVLLYYDYLVFEGVLLGSWEEKFLYIINIHSSRIVNHRTSTHTYPSTTTYRQWPLLNRTDTFVYPKMRYVTGAITVWDFVFISVRNQLTSNPMNVTYRVSGVDRELYTNAWRPPLQHIISIDTEEHRGKKRKVRW